MNAATVISGADGRGFVEVLPAGPADPSWAGAGPARGEFCLGDESGGVTLLNSRNADAKYPRLGNSGTGDPINSVAFGKGRFCASTKSNFYFASTSDFFVPSPTLKMIGVGVGLHGVVAGGAGTIYGAAGASGVMVSPHSTRLDSDLHLVHVRDKSSSVCEVATCRPKGSRELVVLAARRAGIAHSDMSRAPAEGAIVNFRHPEFDAISIASLDPNVGSEQFVALGTNRLLAILPDVRKPPLSRFVRLPEQIGRPYKVLVERGHICVLGSKGLFIYPGLAAKILDPGILDHPITVCHFPLESVDASVAWGRWLSVVTTEAVFVFDLDLLPVYLEFAATRQGPIVAQQFAVPRAFAPKTRGSERGELDTSYLVNRLPTYTVGETWGRAKHPAISSPQRRGEYLVGAV